MKISTKQLRRLIETLSVQNTIPETYRDYRKAIVQGLKLAGAPEDLVEEANDFGDEGSAVFSAIWNGWLMLEYAHKDVESLGGPSDYQQEALEDQFTDAVYETVLNMASAYNNSMNYGPGRKTPRLNGNDLADAVLSALSL